MSGSARDERARWTERWSAARTTDSAPSAWVIEQCTRLPADVLMVDIACGGGRHTVPLARAGRPVVAVDIVELAVRGAGRASPLVRPIVADTGALPLREGAWDAVVVVNFLDRALFPSLIRLLGPGGTLIYETYTVDHLRLTADGRTRGPTDQRYLLERGELSRLVAPLDIVTQREGLVADEAGERFVASIVARRGA